MEIEREHRLTAVEDMAKSNRRRIEELEKRQDNLDSIVGTVRILAEKEKNIETTIVFQSAFTKLIPTNKA